MYQNTTYIHFYFSITRSFFISK